MNMQAILMFGDRMVLIFWDRMVPLSSTFGKVKIAALLLLLYKSKRAANVFIALQLLHVGWP